MMRLSGLLAAAVLLGGCVGLQAHTDAFGRKSYKPVYDENAPMLDAINSAAGRERSSETGMAYDCSRP